MLVHSINSMFLCCSHRMSAFDDDTIRRRLLAKESRLTKVAKKFSQWAAGIDSLSIDESDKMYEQLVRELALYEFNFTKTAIIADTSRRETLKFDTMSQEFQQRMDSLRQELIDLKQQLEVEKINRQHLEQCDRFAHTIHELPSRSELEQQIASVTTELNTLEHEQQSLINQTELRRKQFALLLFALGELQNKLDAEPVVDSAITEDAMQE
eukprot:TRINITY_DN15365_c0_g1_i1.p1 TRINITY_DN15365_c0_g1~~TRINITY_DN15365_c0_g1_i1.p1  ORF type:complete len:211 (+),score=32.87 TRINITY_DN15365_c0_g1_i1:145-777(+)